MFKDKKIQKKFESPKDEEKKPKKKYKRIKKHHFDYKNWENQDLESLYDEYE